MFWQREYIREAKSMTLNDTYRLDLPNHGLLGSLLLRLSGDQIAEYGANGGNWRIIDEIDEVEIIINGATVCKSLKGDMVQAAAFYDNKIISPDSWRNYATNTQWCYMLINFGRFLHDTEYGLDLSKHENVELRIKNTASSTTDFSGLAVSVLGIYLRDGGSFKGYMRTEEWRKWTTVQNETKYLDLPTEHILRRILLQGIPALDANNVEKTGMNNLMDDIELNLESGKVKVYKGGIDDLLRDNYWSYGGLIVTAMNPYHNAGKGINVGIGYVMGAMAGAASAADAVATTFPTLKHCQTGHTQEFENGRIGGAPGLVASGLGYHNSCVYRFDHDKDPASWLDPEMRKTVTLNIHTRDLATYVAGGTNKVILDRLVTY